MDQEKLGKQISVLRREKGFTQEKFGEMLGVTNKAVSRWERGECAPDILTIGAMAAILGVTADSLLGNGSSPNGKDTGNMKRTKFYICPQCGNIITSTGKADISCCCRPLLPMKEHLPDGEHMPDVRIIDDEYYISFPHPMSKSHYISFAAFLNYDRLIFVRLYPEQDCAVRLPRIPLPTLYFACSEHGLFRFRIT